LDTDHDLLLKLVGQVDHIIHVLNDMPDYGKRIRELEASDRVNEEQIATNCKEVEKLRSANTAWSVLNSIAAVMAGLIGWIR